VLSTVPRRMKRALITVLVVSIAGVACGGTSAPTKSPSQSGGKPSSVSSGGLSTYTNTAPGFSIGYPADWDKQEGAAGTIVAFLSPAEGPSDDFRENLNTAIEALPNSSITLDQYTQAVLGKLPKVITGFNLLDQGSTRLGGRPAHRVHYQGEQGMFKLEWEQVWAVQGKQAFILSYAAERDRYAADVSKAEAMFASFKFI
jgi:hypothetical protein